MSGEDSDAVIGEQARMRQQFCPRGVQKIERESRFPGARRTANDDGALADDDRARMNRFRQRMTSYSAGSLTMKRAPATSGGAPGSTEVMRFSAQMRPP